MPLDEALLVEIADWRRIASGIPEERMDERTAIYRCASIVEAHINIRRAPSAPLPEAPIWTTTACPHCGGEVDGIRVLTEAEIGRPASPVSASPVSAAEATLREAAAEVVAWIPKLLAPGGLNPPGYCPPLERLRAALSAPLRDPEAPSHIFDTRESRWVCKPSPCPEHASPAATTPAPDPQSDGE